MKKKGTIIMFVFFIGVFLFILLKVDIKEIADQIRRVNIAYFLVAFLIYVTNNIVRAARFVIFLKIPFKSKIIFITGLYNLMTGLFPMGSGEISLLVMLKRYYSNLPNSKNLSVLLVTRAMDYLIIIVFFLSSFLIISPFTLPLFYQLILVFICLFIILILSRLSQVTALFLKLPKPFGKNKINSFLERFQFAMHEISPKILWNGYLLTLFIWLVNGFVTFLVLNSLQINVDIIKSIYFNTFNVATQVLPLNSIGGFGLKEVTFTIILQTLGYGKTFSLQSSVSIHLLLLSFLIGWGLISFLTIIFKEKESNLMIEL